MKTHSIKTIWKRIFNEDFLPYGLGNQMNPRRKTLIGLACILVGTLSPADAGPYPLRDLGTLGGDASEAFAINDAGYAVGFANDNNGVRYAVVWDPTNDYAAIPIGGESGFDSEARAINAAGTVAGSLAQPGGGSMAFIWNTSNFPPRTDIPLLPGFSSAVVVGINASGQVAGYCAGGGDQRGFLWDSTQGLVDLGTGALTGAVQIQPVALNDDGQVVGTYVGVDTITRGFIWDRLNGLRDIGNLGGSFVAPSAINNLGQVVGQAEVTSPPGSNHAFFWEESGMTDLGTLGGDNSSALDINDAGQIVGLAQLSGLPDFHAFICDDSHVLNDIGVLPGGGFSISLSINEGGVVVGQSEVVMGAGIEYHAIFWDLSRGLVDLGTLGGGLSSAYSLNETGQIVGFSTTADSETHAILIDLTILAPQAAQAAVVSALTQEMAASVQPKDIIALDKIIQSLSQPDIAALWIDPSHLDPQKGDKLFAVDAKAVGDCLALIRSDKDAIPDAVLQEVIEDLVNNTQILAQTAVDEAAAAMGIPMSFALRSVNTGNPSKASKLLVEARKELARAESRVARGKFQEAIKAYGKAWKKAQEALERL